MSDAHSCVVQAIHSRINTPANSRILIKINNINKNNGLENVMIEISNLWVKSNPGLWVNSGSNRDSAGFKWAIPWINLSNGDLT
jgi:hypothetical protein